MARSGSEARDSLGEAKKLLAFNEDLDLLPGLAPPAAAAVSLIDRIEVRSYSLRHVAY